MAEEPSVHVEREKTKRTLIIASAITIVGLTATILFFQNIDDRGGKLVVNNTGVEVTLEKPIPQQVGANTQTVKAFGDSIVVTKGSVPDSALRNIVNAQELRTGAFSGKNLVDTAAGFLMASENPDQWSVERDADGSSTLRDANNSVRVDVIHGATTTLESEAQRLIDSLAAKHIPIKNKLVDTASGTAVLWYTDASTGRTYCVKISDLGGTRYIARGITTDTASSAKVMKLVSSLTPIAKLPVKASRIAPGAIRRVR